MKTCSIKTNRASCNRVERNNNNTNYAELKRTALLRRSQGAAMLDDTNYLPRVTQLKQIATHTLRLELK